MKAVSVKSMVSEPAAPALLYNATKFNSIIGKLDKPKAGFVRPVLTEMVQLAKVPLGAL